MPDWFFLAAGAAVTSLGGIQVAIGLYAWARRGSTDVWLSSVLLGVSFAVVGGGIILRAPIGLLIGSLATLAILVVQLRRRTPVEG